jgi:hypothetical protein
MFLHHCIAISTCLLLTYYQSVQSILLLFAISEITTPFVNNRIFLEHLDMKSSIWFALNGIAMWLGFVIFRFSLVFIIPYILYQQWSTFMHSVPLILRTLVFVFYSLMSVLNTYWTYKITTGLIKVVKSQLRPPQQQEKKKSQ